MNVLDLCSGIGGFSLAAKWAGFTTIAFCEIDPFCQKVLAKNFPGVTIYHDIKEFTVLGETETHGKGIDILTAGFPCQPFSVAGKQKGIYDDRYLWPEIIRVIRECKPTWCILENVPGIIPHLDPILQDLENEKYDWRAFLIPASAVNAPHKRERLWIIAHCNSVRHNERGSDWQERCLQSNWEQYVSKIQSEWTQFQPVTWPTFNVQDWLGFTADATSQRPQGEGQFIESLHPESDSQGETSYVVDDFNNASAASNLHSEPVAQTNSQAMPAGRKRQTRENNSSEHWGVSAQSDRQEDQPRIPRVDDGIPCWLDIPTPGLDEGVPNAMQRNKALGNAIVPQIPYLFFEIIKKIEGIK